MIFTVPDYEAFLHLDTLDVDPTDPETLDTVKLLLEQVKDIGVGLAANQIGRKENIAVIQLDNYDEQGNTEHMTVCINPTMVVDPTQGYIYPIEGCLSVPGSTYITKRYQKIYLSYLDVAGIPHSINLKGFPSVVAQHELGHLMGELICDHGKKVVKQEDGTIAAAEDI